MKAKERHKKKLLEYLGNPENDFCNRERMPSLCGISKTVFRRHFTPTELAEIEQEALEIRRKKYAPRLSQADEALLKRAAEGDVAAIKLAYQRFENWKEGKLNEHTGKDGEPIQQEHKHEHGLSPAAQEMLDKIIADSEEADEQESE